MESANSNTTPPKAVVFDLGKVLLDFDYSRAVGRLLPLIHVELEVVKRLLIESPLLFDYETGRLNTEQFFERIREVTGFSAGLPVFEAIFGDIFTEITPMTALLPQLKRLGVRCSVFSNTNEMAIRHVTAQYPFYNGFDDHILSFEHRAMKPDPALYAVVEQTLSLNGPDLLYLDDREENVVAGRERGWRAFVHRDPQESIQHLREAGLAVG
jgi:FMN phosphatase YigB (HAD superfamily)